MVVLLGLLALIAAVAAVATNSDSTQLLSDNFVISGQHFNGLCTGQQVLCGIAVRLVDLLRSGNPVTHALAVLTEGIDKQQFGRSYRPLATRQCSRTYSSAA